MTFSESERGIMRSAKEILESLGFNQNAPESTQKAFLKNLVKAAQENQKAEVIVGAFGLSDTLPVGEDHRQLSFDSELLGVKSLRLKMGS